MSKTPDSKSSFVQWILKSSRGEETGPFSTEAVIRMISGGSLRGDEKIRKAPHGKWLEISRQTEFYDSLLKVLEESVKADPQAKRRMDTTRVIPNYEQKDEETSIPEKKQIDETPVFRNEILLPKAKFETSTFVPPVPESPMMIRDIPQRPRRNLDDKSRKLVMAGALFVVVAAALVLLALLTDSGAGSGEKKRLLAPRPTQADSLTKAEASDLLKKSVSFFLSDTYEGYLQSQNYLVSLIEGAPKQSQNLDARGLLCLVYKELWPFVVQDSQDLEAVHLLTKSTRQKDPFGINGIYCEVSRLMILGKYNDAKGVLDHSLNQPQLSSAPILFNLKAEILAEDHEPQTAALYAEKAMKLWPEWIKPQFDYAQDLRKSKQIPQALAAYQKTLKANPRHKATMIELGVLQFKEFHQTDLALNQLLAAVSSNSLVQKITLARGHLTLAEIYLEKSEPRKALEYAQNSYDLNPGDVRSRDLIIRLGGSGKLPQKASQTNEIVFLGDQYFRSGDCLAAQAEYKTAYDLDPKNGIAAMKAARCLWQLNQSPDAISWLTKAIAADNKLVSAYVLQADYFSQRYNYGNAIQTLNKASQVLTNNYEILRGYGLVEFRRNNLKEALAFLQRSFKMYENDVETLILLAKVNGGLREHRESLNFALRAIELDSTNNDAQMTYAKAIAQLDGIDAGITYLKSLISKFSYTLDFRIGLAELYREAERYKVAQDLYQQIVEVDPRNKKAFLGLGEAFQAQGLADKALRAYLSAAILDPSDAEGVFRTGLVYLEQDKYREAILQFQRALQINALFPRVNYSIGKAFFKNGQTEDALQSAMNERKLNPNIADSYLLAAEIYTSTKQYLKCAEEYQMALKIRPLGADLYVRLARCYRQGGNSDIAENMLNIAATQESGLPEIYKEQGAIYQTKGDILSAVKAYNKYLALSPNAPDRREIESEILKLSSGK